MLLTHLLLDCTSVAQTYNVCRVSTYPLSEIYAIFDVAENRFIFYSQNAPKSFVAGLYPDPLGELTAALPAPQTAFDGPTSERGERKDEEEREGKGRRREGRSYAPLLKNSSYATAVL